VQTCRPKQTIIQKRRLVCQKLWRHSFQSK